MRGARSTGLAALVIALALAAPAEARHFHLPKSTHQLVVVIADGWSSTSGKLTRFQRGEKGGWKEVGAPIEVQLGSAGLGWGLGLHPIETAMERSGPLKEEGDDRSPAGVFQLLETTGYAPKPPPGTTLSYTQATAQLRCVTDRKSKSYNQLVLAPASGAASGSSDEPMKRSDALYQLTIVVEHNRHPVVPGQGSCVFLRAGNGQPTDGSTALPAAEMAPLITWLDASAHPLLVQLPEKDYRELAHAWRLPPPKAAPSESGE